MSAQNVKTEASEHEPLDWAVAKPVLRKAIMGAYEAVCEEYGQNTPDYVAYVETRLSVGPLYSPADLKIVLGENDITIGCILPAINALLNLPEMHVACAYSKRALLDIVNVVCASKRSMVPYLQACMVLLRCLTLPSVKPVAYASICEQAEGHLESVRRVFETGKF